MAKGWTMAALLKKKIQIIGEPSSKADEQKYVKKVQAGRKANAGGNEWQKRLDDYHDGLLRRGLMAKVFRQYPPMRAIYQNSSIIWKAEGKGPCDYCLIFSSGLAGLYDAKSTGNNKQFTWSSEQVHQLAEMRDLHRVTKGKSPAFAMVNWYGVGEVRVHPIYRIDGRTVKRMDGIPVHEVNWLPVVLAEWNIRKD